LTFQLLLYTKLHIFKTHGPNLMLVAVLERARAALSLAAISTKNGVKEKDLQKLKKSPN
jgi:hypothetical protein